MDRLTKIKKELESCLCSCELKELNEKNNLVDLFKEIRNIVDNSRKIISNYVKLLSRYDEYNYSTFKDYCFNQIEKDNWVDIGYDSQENPIRIMFYENKYYYDYLDTEKYEWENVESFDNLLDCVKYIWEDGIVKWANK